MIASVVGIIRVKAEDYYEALASTDDTRAETNNRRNMIEAAILIIILTSWIVYLYTVAVEHKPKTSEAVIRKEVTEVHIQTEKGFHRDLKDNGSQTESKRVRTVKTQSQCKYTYWNQQPRFQPLPENTHGCETDGDPYAWSYM